VVLGLGLALWPQLGAYGPNWDEALGPLFYGERYAAFYLEGDTSALQFERPHGADRGPGHPDLAQGPRFKPWAIWALPNFLSSLGCRIFHRGLGLEWLVAHHATNLLLFLAFVLAAAWITASFLPRSRLLLATLLCVLSPHFHTHLLVNTKDLPMALGSTLLLLAWYRWRLSFRRFDLLLCALIFGLALSIKVFALFQLVAIGCFEAAALALSWFNLGRPEFGRVRRVGTALLIVAGIGVLVACASWPYLWDDTFERLRQHWVYLRVESMRGGLVPDFSRRAWQFEALASFFCATPSWWLGLAVLGGVAAWRRRSTLAALLALGLFFELYKNCLPGVARYDGIRHFLAAVPLSAFFAAEGVAAVAAALRTHRVPVALPAAFLALAPLHQLGPYYPWTYCYYNGLCGGLGGVRSSFDPDAGDYWALSYREGLAAVARRFPQGALLTVPIAEHLAALLGPEQPGLRLVPTVTPQRISLEPEEVRALVELGERQALVALFIERPGFDNDFTRLLKHSYVPLEVMERDGQPIRWLFLVHSSKLRDGSRGIVR